MVGWRSLPEAVSDLFGKRMLFEISVDSDNIRGKSSQYLVCCDDREMIEEFAAFASQTGNTLDMIG